MSASNNLAGVTSQRGGSCVWLRRFPRSLAAGFADGDEEHAGKCHQNEKDSVVAMQLVDLAVEESKSAEDEEDVRTEDFEGCFAKDEEGFDENDARDDAPGAVGDTNDGDE